MGSLERGGADEVINLPVKTGRGAAPGCPRGPCGPFSARGLCLLHLPPRSGSQLPSGLFRFPLCHSLRLLSRAPFFVSASVYLFGCLSLPFWRLALGQENFKVMASGLASGLGSRVSDTAPQPWLGLRELEIRGGIHSTSPQERGSF